MHEADLSLFVIESNKFITCEIPGIRDAYLGPAKKCLGVMGKGVKGKKEC